MDGERLRRLESFRAARFEGISCSRRRGTGFTMTNSTPSSQRCASFCDYTKLTPSGPWAGEQPDDEPQHR
jgi:hypothetical protein